MEEKIFNTDNDYKKEDYWNKWLCNASQSVGNGDWLIDSVYEVMKLAIDNKQYSIPENEYEDVQRVIKVNLGISRKLIEQMFGVKTYSIYGTGVYVLMEGVVLSKCTRNEIGYDTIENTGKRYRFDPSTLPSEILETHEIRLAVPALGGLFVPVKSRITNWIGSKNRLQYFDLMNH